MTLAQIRTLVLSFLDDPDAGYFTNAQTLVFINNAQREVQKTLGQAFEAYNIKKVKTTMVVGQKEYALPSDFKRLHRLEIVISGSPPNETLRRLTKITRNQQDEFPTTYGSPVAYFFQGNYLILVQAPDTAQVLRMEYEYLAADLSNDSDSPDLPSQYHEMIAIMAARDGLIKDGRDAALMQRKIDEFKELMKQDAEQRNVDQPRSVIQTRGDDSSFDDGW